MIPGKDLTVRYKVNLQVAPKFKRTLAPPLLRAAARAALEHQAAFRPSALTIVVTDDAELHRLNREYLGHDYATDVLSFPSEETDLETGERYWGDIALSLPRARAQAKARGHSVIAEVRLLIVHGVLHLLGHDHALRTDKERMWAAQVDILRRLKSPIIDVDAVIKIDANK